MNEWNSVYAQAINIAEETRREMSYFRRNTNGDALFPLNMR